MRKLITIGVTAMLSSMATWYVTSFYYNSLDTHAAERVISSEISLLEKAKEFAPPCAALTAKYMTPVVNDENHVTVWKLSEDNNHIDKFVVDSTFSSAYEQVANNCGGK